MDKEQFFIACESEKLIKGIGTLSEKTLHSILKNYFEPYPENHEIKVGGFVADIVSEKGIIEIQTRQFNKLLKKLNAFLEVCEVTIVYPIAEIKWLHWIDLETGETSKKRKSNRKGMPCDIFFELYKIKSVLKNPRLKLCICMLEIEEYRYLNGWSKDKKKGSSRCDRIPVNIFNEINIEYTEDYKKLIPDGLAKEFSAKDFAKKSRLSVSHSQIALNVLNFLEVVTRIGKKRNAFIYQINESIPSFETLAEEIKT